MATLGEYNRDDVLKRVNRELDAVLSYTTAFYTPKAILLAGQPGAGKTELSTMILSMLKANGVFINGDEYRRYHTQYKEIFSEYGVDTAQYTSKFSAEVTEKLIDRVSEQKRNIIIEGTGRTVEVPVGTLA